MRLSHLRLFCLCSLGLIAACGDDPVTPVEPPEDPPVWTEFTGLPPATTLYAVWVPQENYAIGVGPRGAIQRWDGLRWAAIENESARSLYAVTGVTGGETIAAGNAGEIVRFNGTRFTPVATPTTEDLRGLWTPGSNAFIAVGNNGVILRGNGVSWALDSNPTTDPLFGIWGSGPDDVFAVGLNGAILHFDGVAWMPMNSGTSALLAAVSGTGPDDVYAVGGEGTILHFDGAAWTPMTSGTRQLLQGVAAGALTIAVGANGTILGFDNGGWRLHPDITHEWLYATAQFGTQTWAVGTRAVFAHDGTGWRAETHGVVPLLNGIAGPPLAPLRVVGESGYVARKTASGWQPEDAGAPLAFNAIWCAQNGDVFAVGRNRIARHDGTAWTEEFGSPADLFDVNGGPAGIHAVGLNAAIYRRNAGTWTPVRPTTPVFDALHAYVSIAAKEAYIVGANGRILVYNGITWSTSGPIVSADLYDAAAGRNKNEPRVIAVGEAGTIVGLSPTPGARWTVIDSPTTFELRALARGPDGRLYAVGQSGVVVACNGNSWVKLPSPTLMSLRSAWSDGPNLFVAGGDPSGGTILLRYGAP